MSRQSDTGNWRESAGGTSEGTKSVANTTSGRRSGSGLPVRSGQSPEATVDAAGTSEGVGNAEMLDGTGQAGGQRQTQARGTGAAQHERQTQSTLGGDADGTPSGLDYAELCSTCDNRTDELRLLGNGVVPATAEKAFRTLWQELNTKNADAFKATE